VVRLPTEPEWEYDARGGQAVAAEAFRYPLPPLAEDFARYAWTAANAGADPWLIGTRLAGPLGPHDLFGNVSDARRGAFGSATRPDRIRSSIKVFEQRHRRNHLALVPLVPVVEGWL